MQDGSMTPTLPIDAPKRFQALLDDATRITLITHIDMDGMAAAKLLFASRFGARFGRVYFTDSAKRDLRDYEVAEIVDYGSDLVLVTDLSPHNYIQMNQILEGRRGAIVDHHRPKDYKQVPNLNTEFLTYKLVPDDPDRFSTTLTLAKLLEDQDGAEFVIAALIGDKNYAGFEAEYPAGPTVLEDARFLGALYKRMGWMTPLDPRHESRADAIRQILFERLLEARSASTLRGALMASGELADTFAAVEADKKRLIDAACATVAEHTTAAALALVFVPRSGFVLAGFIYELEAALAQCCPSFKGFCNVAQATPKHWQLDGCTTDTARYDAGGVFGQAGVGGGHRNAGGGRLEPSEDPLVWLQAQPAFVGQQVVGHTIG